MKIVSLDFLALVKPEMLKDAFQPIPKYEDYFHVTIPHYEYFDDLQGVLVYGYEYLEVWLTDKGFAVARIQIKSDTGWKNVSREFVKFLSEKDIRFIVSWYGDDGWLKPKYVDIGTLLT
jgi:hypothetical protein